MKSEIRGIELVARMVVRNDVGDESSWSPTLPEAVDEQHIECGIVLTQPSQKTQADTVMATQGVPHVVVAQGVPRVSTRC
jgi:hypothetical protein